MRFRAGRYAGAVFVAILAGVVCGPHACGQGARGGASSATRRVNIDPPSEAKFWHGYAEYRIQIAPGAAGDFHFSFPPHARSETREPHLRFLTCRGVVAEGERKPTTMLQPALPLRGDRLGGRIAGQPFEKRVAPTHAVPWPRNRRDERYRYYYHEEKSDDRFGEIETRSGATWMWHRELPRSVLLSSEAAQRDDAIANAFDDSIRYFDDLRDDYYPAEVYEEPVTEGYDSLKTAESVSRFPTWGQLTERPVTQWSTRWLAYSSQDGIVLTQGEFETLREQHEKKYDAVLNYVASGGLLLVFKNAEESFDWGEVWKEGSSAIHETRADADAIDRVRLGFGECIAIDSDADGWDGYQWSHITDGLFSTGNPWISARSELDEWREANDLVPVVKDVRIPVVGLLVVLVFFVALVGPASLYLLKRLNRRTWLLWTVPAMSLLTCLIVLVYAFFGEGFQPTIRVSTLTYLDQVTGRSSTVGYLAYYSPLTPRGGLSFDASTEISPILDRITQKETGGRSIAWQWDTNAEGKADAPRLSQQLTSGWVAARVPAHFMVRRTVTDSPRRLSVRWESNRPTVTNELDTKIRRLVLADAEGRVFVGSDIGTDPVTLEEAGEMPVGRPDLSLREIYRDNWGFATHSDYGDSPVPDEMEEDEISQDRSFTHLLPQSLWGTQPVQLIRPGAYVALLAAETPFVGKGLSGTRFVTGKDVRSSRGDYYHDIVSGDGHVIPATEDPDQTNVNFVFGLLTSQQAGISQGQVDAR